VKLISFLVKQSPAVLALAVLTGITGGAASAGLMALVNHRLTRLDEPAAIVAWAFAGVTALVLVSHLCSRLLLLRLSTRAILRVRLHLCRQILLSPLPRLERHGSPRIMAALTEDILAVSDTLADFPLLCINAAVIVACFSYLFWLNASLALAFVAFFAVGVLTYELIERRTRPYLAQGRETWDVLIGFYQVLIHGNKELKLHRSRREAFLSEGLDPTALTMQRLSFSWHSLFAVAASYGQILYFLAIGAVLFLAPLFGSLDLPVLAGFTLLTIYMNGPISFIVGTLPAFERAAVSVGKIESLGLSLATGRPSDMLGPDVPPVRSFSSIVAVGVTYVYHQDDEDRAFTLGPIDLTLYPGELTFIIGGNGSGKSSFARLVTGLYAPESGTILFNGHAVSDDNRDHYRQHFSVVFSDYYLFDQLFGLMSDDVSERAATYLSELRLTGKVKVVDGKFSTTNLSQGQRKRLALLTAFIEDRHIYLFDEWAADQDPAFKEVFYRHILPELKARGKTVLVISHDEHFYDVADRILKFEDGQLVEDRYNDARRELEPALSRVIA
jgi:putative ATP-binding cassette transporter